MQCADLLIVNSSFLLVSLKIYGALVNTHFRNCLVLIHNYPEQFSFDIFSDSILFKLF